MRANNKQQLINEIRTIVRNVLKEEFDYTTLFDGEMVKGVEEKTTNSEEKESHKKNIRATGDDWNDAMNRRLKDVKKGFVLLDTHIKANKDIDTVYKYLLEDIDFLEEMGFEAKGYAKNLRKVAKEKILNYKNKK